MMPVRRLAGLPTRRCVTLLRAASVSRTPSYVLPLSHRAYSVTNLRRQATAFHEQLEKTPNAADLLSSAPVVDTPQTMTEKIFQRYSVGLAPGKKVRAGDFITIQPHHCMTHDNTAPVIAKWETLHATKVHDPKQLVFTLDHDVQNKSDKNLSKYRKIENFAKTHGIDFYGAGMGIGHQIMVQEGYAWPGTLCVASDSHSNHYGGVGCGTPVVRTDAAAIYAVGKTWLQVPPVAKVTLTGVMPPGVSGKDAIITLIGMLNNDEVLNHSIEFVGSEETLRSIPIDFRLTMSNKTTEWGCLSAIWPIDSVLISWLRANATTSAMLNPELGEQARFNHKRIDELVQNPVAADPGATYAKSYYLNLSTLSPIVSGPNSVKIATPVRELEAQKVPINKAYLISCTNARASDIAASAKVFRDAAENGDTPKIAPGVQYYVAAASLKVQQDAEESGDWQILLDAGATPLTSGCAACIGMGVGLLEEGEVGISASNRNYKGRMGSPKAKAYLASPEIVAASALKGYISGTGWYEKPDGVEKVIIGEGTGNFEADKATSIEDALDKLIAQAESMIVDAEKDMGDSTQESTQVSAENGKEILTEILPGFPEKVEGEILFLDVDNLSTDGIYPGKYTYQDDLTEEDMARVCMENYDPDFGKIARPGMILVGGSNLGTGSSREQAATSILAKKIPLVVAASFGNIFSRNSINNALMGLEVPKLVQRLRERFPKKDGDAPLTRSTGWKLLWDVRRSKVVVTEDNGETWTQPVGELPPNVQEVIAKGGLEKWLVSKVAEES